MKRLSILILCLVAMSARAQRLSHDFQNASLSEALIWIDNAQKDYKLNFIFNELEDFTVTTRLENVSVRDAVRQVCGFYPMHLTFDHQDIFIECTQKEEAKVIGRVVDERGNPIEFANIALLQQEAFINGGVSNENGDFVIPCKAQQITLKVSYVGYKTVTRNINGVTSAPSPYSPRRIW